MEQINTCVWAPKKLHNDYKKACEKLGIKMRTPILNVMQLIVKEAKKGGDSGLTYRR